MIATHLSGGASTAVLQALHREPGRRIVDLPEELGLSYRQVRDAAAKLRRRGLLDIAPGGLLSPSEAGRHAAEAGGPLGASTHSKVRRLRDTFRQRIWRSMRFRRRFTVADLVLDAAREGDALPHDNARRYLSRLRQAGYVAELPARAAPTRWGSNGLKKYMLRRDTGTAAPIYRAGLRAVHDPNTGEDVPCSP